jgi:hypothetical protein
MIMDTTGDLKVTNEDVNLNLMYEGADVVLQSQDLRGSIVKSDEFGKVFISDGDIERIARRVVELLKAETD